MNPKYASTDSLKISIYYILQKKKEEKPNANWQTPI